MEILIIKKKKKILQELHYNIIQITTTTDVRPNNKISNLKNRTLKELVKRFKLFKESKKKKSTKVYKVNIQIILLCR